MSFNIFLDSDIISDSNISNDGLFAYVLLRGICQNDVLQYYTTVSTLNCLATGKPQYNRSISDSIKRGIKNLSEHNVIEIKHKSTKSEFFLDLSNIQFSTKTKKKYFRVISRHELETIMGSNTHHNKVSILKFFLVLVNNFIVGEKGSIQYQGRDISGIFATRTTSFLSDKSGLSESVIFSYTKFLERDKLIYVYRSSDLVFSEFSIKSIPNVHSRYEYREEVAKMAAQFEYDHGVSTKNTVRKHNKNKANTLRSHIMKYYSFTKGVVYPEETLKEIYEYLLQYNETHPDKAKDLEVFTSYSFANQSQENYEFVSDNPSFADSADTENPYSNLE